MMPRNAAYFAIACFISGTLFFCVYNNIIVIGMPLRSHTMIQPTALKTAARRTTLFFWRNHRWNHEEANILWSHDAAHNIGNLIGKLLTIWDEEEITPKQVTLQSVIIDPSQQIAYLSFDRNPFNKQHSISEKLHLIEALLKTIRENGIAIPTVQFLVHHAPLEDPHLDFSQPWPINGFLT